MVWNDKMMQNHLPVGGIEENRTKYCDMINNVAEYRILDIGFGTGVNTLLAINHIQSNFGDKKILIYGIDNNKYLLDYANHVVKQKIIDQQDKILESLSSRRIFETNNLKIRLLDGDVSKIIHEIPPGFNYVFCDLFHEGPWNTSFLHDLKQKLAKGALLSFPTNDLKLHISLNKAGYKILNKQTVPFSYLKASNP